MKSENDKTGAPRAEGVGLAAVLVSMAGLWAAYFAMATLRGLVLEFDFQDALLARRFVVALAGVGVTVLVWLLLRGFDNRRMGVRIVAAMIASLPASLLLAVINQQAFADVEARIVRNVGSDQGVKIRRDEAGNLLVDVPGVPGDDVPPPPPVPSSPPEPRAPPSVTVDVTRTNGDTSARTTVTQEMVRLEEPLRQKIMWQQLTDIALGRYFLLLSWCAIYIALSQAVQARVAERREGEYRRAAKAAELRSLRYQVNPHFLFNTLNSLSALVMTDRKAQAETMIQTISTFYRRSLSGDPTLDVPLAEEIELQRLYLQIEGVRFPDRLRVAMDIPADLATARIPGMILQPLIENSVRYGVAPVNRPVTIRLTAAEEHGQLMVAVSDDGPGASAEQGQHGFGIGLANVRDRLKARFGSAASVVSGPAEQGWRTVLRMPLSFAAGGAPFEQDAEEG